MTVSISEGLSLTDRDANRFARHMLDELDMFAQKALTAIGETTRRNGASLGNPKGQHRAYMRIAKAMGPTLLRGFLDSGKKGIFSFHYTTFSRIDGGDLFMMLLTMNGRQKPHDDRLQIKELMRFTAHSLQRLVQRAGVREADDYVPILKALAIPSLLLSASVLSETKSGEIPCGQWPLPVKINGERIILVVKTPAEDPIPTAVTVYKGEWRNQPAMLQLEDMLDKFESQEDPEDLTPFWHAFNAAAKHLSDRQ